VDGEEQAPLLPGRPFALPDAAVATLLAFESGEARERFAGEHHGYAALGVVHQRELRLTDGGLAIVDRLLGAGRRELELRFPLPSIEARVRPLRPAERERARALLAAAGLAEAPELDLERGVEIGPADAPVAVLAAGAPARLAVQLAPSAWSPGYGERVEARTAAFAGRLALPATLVTVVLPLAAREPELPEELEENRT
jgi:hypothetical protein